MPVPTFAEWCIYADALKMLRIFIEGRCAYIKIINWIVSKNPFLSMYYVVCHHHH